MNTSWRHDVEIGRHDGHRADERVARHERQMQAEADTFVRIRGWIVQHRRHEHRVAAVYAIPEQTRKDQRSRFLPCRADAEHDRTEQLALLRHDEVYVVNDGLWYRFSRRIHDLDSQSANP